MRFLFLTLLCILYASGKDFVPFEVPESTEQAKPAIVFASGNNKFVLPDLIESFYLKYPDARVLIQYGASGDLTNSILAGAHYDIFLSADMAYPKKIYKAGKSVTAPKKYIDGQLILFVPADRNLTKKGVGILKESKIRHITVANRKTAPYGKAVIEALRNTGLYKILEQKIRYSTDVSMAVINVAWYDDAVFLPKSAVGTLPAGYRQEGVNWIDVDPAFYAPIHQGYVVSSTGLKNNNAVKFLNYLLSKEGQEIYRSYGYR